MSKYIKWNYEKVKEFVDKNSNCEVLTEDYKNIDSPMTFICECGNEFTTTFYRFKNRNKRQCNLCGNKLIAKSQKLTYEEVKNFIENTSNSGCKLLSETYKNAHEKLKIQCECGNIYAVKYGHFKNSNQRQCPQCGYEITANAKRIPLEKVKATIEKEGCKLLSNYANVKEPILIECSCGREYKTTFGMFRDLGFNKCKTCRDSETITSKGEDRIRKWLTSHNIDFLEEFTFNDLRHGKCLRFDFAIFNKSKNLKILIEYDGRQHYGLGLFSDDTVEMISSYQRTIQSDYDKNEYCFINSIPLLRIHYNKINNIENILENLLM